MQAPIFIFSLPRSGSTLLQRVLMSHEDVCSVAEPWVLLPQMYLLKEKGTLSEYSSLTTYWAVKDFINNLPNKEIDYNESLKTFILDLYSKQCQNNERYFLDKTPRYYLIIDEIVNLFPEAKFIFLFRNPIQAYASVVKTWGNNRFNKIRSSYDDIVLGTQLLSEGYNKHKDKSIAVNYEKLVVNFETELKHITDYLDLDLNHSILNDFHTQDTKGSLGDPTGVKKYSSISNKSLTTWEKVFNSSIRKKYALWLLNEINDKHLRTQGYSKENITKEIKRLDSKNNHLIIKDCFDYFNNFLTRKFKLTLVFSKKFSWIKKKYLS
ncbi:sulfotransferase family protein [Psychroserpens jangbogonensis]|uniref:sulfotransferase family protein n=1 Tax=Psychroserpens jangbogonensis TaxID=1484460 RepID=UPI00053D93B1|nr:sulfotransferase [Psychroserpens jangbogonensis]